MVSSLIFTSFPISIKRGREIGLDLKLPFFAEVIFLKTILRWIPILGSYLKKKFLKKEAVPSAFHAFSEQLRTPRSTTKSNTKTAVLLLVVSKFFLLHFSPKETKTSQFLPIKLLNPTIIIDILRPPAQKRKNYNYWWRKKKLNSRPKKGFETRENHQGPIWAALDKNNLISKELGDILDSNFGHMDKKLFINESKNQARKSGKKL